MLNGQLALIVNYLGLARFHRVVQGLQYHPLSGLTERFVERTSEQIDLQFFVVRPAHAVSFEFQQKRSHSVSGRAPAFSASRIRSRNNRL